MHRRSQYHELGVAFTQCSARNDVLAKTPPGIQQFRVVGKHLVNIEWLAGHICDNVCEGRVPGIRGNSLHLCYVIHLLIGPPISGAPSLAVSPGSGKFVTALLMAREYPDVHLIRALRKGSGLPYNRAPVHGWARLRRFERTGETQEDPRYRGLGRKKPRSGVFCCPEGSDPGVMTGTGLNWAIGPFLVYKQVVRERQHDW